MKKLKNYLKVKTKIITIFIVLFSVSVLFAWDDTIPGIDYTLKSVGIGTNNPIHKLQINDGGIGFSGYNILPNGKQLYSPVDGLLEWMTHDAAGTHAFAVSHQGVRKVWLDTNGNSYLIGGNVGIGTTNPIHKLQIDNGGLGFSGPNHLADGKQLYSPADGLLEWMTHDWAGAHAFAVSHQGVRRVWLDTNGSSYLIGGNVGIGTTTPQSKLHVVGETRIDGTIISSGLVTNGTVTAQTYSCLSDLRYKKDIAPLTSALEKLSLLNGVYYNWKSAEFKDKGFSDKRDMGFIAQDLEKVFPEVVYTDSKGYKSVAYSKLTAVIVEALKSEHKLTLSIQKSTSSLEEKVASLQKENAELKQQIASLKKMSEKVAQLEDAMKMYMVGME